MNLINQKYIVELGGIAAIVASLVFVGLELRQSQEIAIAAQYQERSNSGTEFMYNRLESKSELLVHAERLNSRGWPAGFLSDQDKIWLESHSPLEWAEADTWGVISLFIFDNYHFQYQSGYLNEEAWQSIRSQLHSFVANSLFIRNRIVNLGDRWMASFVELCLEMIEEAESENSSD